MGETFLMLWEALTELRLSSNKKPPPLYPHRTPPIPRDPPIWVSGLIPPPSHHYSLCLTPVMLALLQVALFAPCIFFSFVQPLGTKKKEKRNRFLHPYKRSGCRNTPRCQNTIAKLPLIECRFCSFDKRWSTYRLLSDREGHRTKCVWYLLNRTNFDTQL